MALSNIPLKKLLITHDLMSQLRKIIIHQMASLDFNCSEAESS